MSDHWKPGQPSDWTVIEGYASRASSRRGLVPVIVSAVVIGLAAGGILSWTARHADSGPSAAIEWNAVQAVPTRAPDAEDVAWEKRTAQDSPSTGSGRAEAVQATATGSLAKGLYVIDGDTFSYGGQRIRIAGMDAPETHPPRCAQEAQLGRVATEKLRALLGSGSVTISGAGHDRYGRELRTVQVDGVDVGEIMIGAGLARNYDGNRRQGWC